MISMEKFYLKDLKAYLESKNISNKKFAEDVGVTEQAISNLFSGITKEPYKTNIRKMAEALGKDSGRDKGGPYFIDKQTDFDELVQQTGQMGKESEASYAGLPDEDRKAAETFIDLLKNGPEKEKKIITSVLEVLKGDGG